jgi:hypothetical protein
VQARACRSAILRRGSSSWPRARHARRQRQRASFHGRLRGILLYQTLHDYGFASSPHSISKDDVLTLRDCRITNAVKCLPPQNKPVPSEIGKCNAYLNVELATLPKGRGGIGARPHRARATALTRARPAAGEIHIRPRRAS